jgi:hypothetical protein
MLLDWLSKESRHLQEDDDDEDDDEDDDDFLTAQMSQPQEE